MEGYRTGRFAQLPPFSLHTHSWQALLTQQIPEQILHKQEQPLGVSKAVTDSSGEEQEPTPPRRAWAETSPVAAREPHLQTHPHKSTNFSLAWWSPCLALQEGTCPSCRPLAPKGSTAQTQGRRAFNFFLFSYFCINFSFSWRFSVQWPLEFGFFDSWRDAQKIHSASKEIHNLAFKGNSIKWYGCSLILYLTSELSSHLLSPKWLNKESSKERFKGTVGKRKPAPHPTFLPKQSRRLSGEGRIHTQTLWKEGNVIEATDAEATWVASRSQLLNLYTSRINCINSGV